MTQQIGGLATDVQATPIHQPRPLTTTSGARPEEFNMSIRLSMIAAVAAGVGLLATATSAPAAEEAKIGEPAPEFTLKDTKGDSHSLSDFRGKTVVLQWINPDCPFCVACVKDGRVGNMLKEFESMDKEVVYLPINSTHYMEPAKTASYLTSYNVKQLGLIDRDGKVGNLYKAKTTPHIYVIDGEGVLRYTGALDNQKRGTPATENYGVTTVRAIAAGETVSPATTRPYGCSVKYKKN